MSNSYNPITPISLSYGQGITALSFDPSSDVLWAGTNGGYVTANCSPEGMRMVSFKTGELAVQKIVSGDSYVRAMSVSGDGLGSWSKGGMNKWFYRSSHPLTAFASSVNTSNMVAVSCATSELIFLNAVSGKIVRQMPTASLITHLDYSASLLVSASSDGILRTHDVRATSSRAEHSARAHQSGFLGLQASGNNVYSIGTSTRQGRDVPDPMVKVFDVRTMKPLPPVPFSATPAYINIMPRKASTIAITSSQGLVNVVDVANLSSPHEFYQLDVASYATSVAVSPTGTYIACGDAEGTIHLLTQADVAEELPPFNGFEGQPVEWADVPEPPPEMEWTDATPLNTIGMPRYDAPLLSSWSKQLTVPNARYPPPAKIPMQILNNIKVDENLAYAALPKEFRGKRNVVQLAPQKSSARFRSGKSNPHEPVTPISDNNTEDVPKMYRHVEIQYSKFGVEDFDFGFYNKTQFSGLETHILNSYTNAMVQVMHYSLPIRRVAKSHITVDCLRENCLLCELGFVTRMLEDARGTNCQTSNFCKTVGALAHATNSTELVDYGRQGADVDYSRIMQGFHRFLLDSMASEGDMSRHIQFDKVRGGVALSPITQLLGLELMTVTKCFTCNDVRRKTNILHVIDMVYPRRSLSNEPQQSASDLASVVRNSILKNMSFRTNCQACGQFASFSSQRYTPTRDLPHILAMNASISTDEHMKFWQNTRAGTFLRPTIEIQGQVNGEDDPDSAVYELKAIIVQVSERDHNHLVALIKVPDSEKTEESPWYLFNDFVVRNVSEQDAMSMPSNWKVPSVLHFERIDTQGNLDFSGLPSSADDSILCHDTSISRNRNPNLVKHTVLSTGELPRAGTLVAIDAEFVSMQQEEIEYRSDGSHKVLRPARMSLARVSVLRGDGEKQGVPLIDDHIHTSETIVDYLTEYSGIRFGDLDPNHSPHTLTPLKVVYKKLRLLVDRGCVFIGHGLSKDFRIINIFVPPDQVIDTVDLYFMRARQRRLSLRFLSWFVLHENIQTDTHDSIEDAKCALDLYKEYLIFESEGVFDKKLEEIYKEGKQVNFRPPPAVDAQRAPNVQAADSPPTLRYSVPGPRRTATQTNMDARFAQKYPTSGSSTPVPGQGAIGSSVSNPGTGPFW